MAADIDFNLQYFQLLIAFLSPKPWNGTIEPFVVSTSLGPSSFQSRAMARAKGRHREAILDRHEDHLYTSRLKPRSGTGARMDQSIAAAEQPRYIKLNERDNVAIVVNDFGLPAGSQFSCGLQLRAFVPQGHKTALVDIEKGAPILRYG